jgi:hypothetical protein
MASIRTRDAAVLLPAAAGAAGLGVLASELPAGAVALVGFSGLLFLPWVALFFLFVLTSMIQNDAYGILSGLSAGGYTFSWAHLILIPFAIRAYLFARQGLRPKWSKPEWIIAAFAFMQLLITFRQAPSFKQSLGALGLLALGVLAYVAVYAAVSSSRRLLIASKVFLWLILANAVYGILAMGAHLVLHTHFGVSTRSAFGDGVYGLSLEHDIFASTCGAGAIAFYVLWRERNPLFSRGISAFAVWACGVASLLGLARGAWLGEALAFLALMVLPRTGRRRIQGVERVGFTLLLVAVLGLGASYIVGTSGTVGTQLQGIEDKLSNLLNLNTGTGLARLGETQIALDDWKESPVFGLGAGSYDQRHPQKLRTNYIGNIYLRALYETGLVGALLLISFFLLLFWPNKTLLFGVSELAPVARALTFGGAVLTVAYAATDSTLQVWPWIFFALIRAARLLSERSERALKRVPARPGAVPAVAVEGNGASSIRPPVAVPAHGPARAPWL